MKKNDLLVKMISCVTANSVLFASCTPQAGVNTEDVLNFKRANFATNPVSVDQIFDKLYNLTPEQKEMANNTIKLVSDLSSDKSLQDELKSSPDLVFERYNMNHPVALKNKETIVQLFSFSDERANALLQKRDIAGYINRLKETGIIQPQEEYSLSSIRSLEMLQTRSGIPGEQVEEDPLVLFFICFAAVLVYVAVGTIAVAALCVELEAAVHIHAAAHTHTSVGANGVTTPTGVDLNNVNPVDLFNNFTMEEIIDAIEKLDISELDKAVLIKSLTDAQYALYN